MATSVGTVSGYIYLYVRVYRDRASRPQSISLPHEVLMDKVLMDKMLMDEILMDGVVDKVEGKRDSVGRRGVYILLDDGCLGDEI